MLLSVGDAADGAMGRAFVDVLMWDLLFSQRPTEAPLQGGGGVCCYGQGDGLRRNQHGERNGPLVFLTQRLGTSVGDAWLVRLATLDHIASFISDMGAGFDSGIRGETRRVMTYCGNLQGQWRSKKQKRGTMYFFFSKSFFQIK